MFMSETVPSQIRIFRKCKDEARFQGTEASGNALPRIVCNDSSVDSLSRDIAVPSDYILVRNGAKRSK